MKLLENPFALDLRSLSLMRIGIGLVLLVDLAIRSGDLSAHYTEQGILPVSLLFQYHWLPDYFSIYLIGNSPFLVSLLFIGNAGCLLALTLGYRTSLFSILSWVFLVSLQNRNGLIQQGGDDLLRLLLFWGMFLPWGTYFSYDAKQRGKVVPSYTSVAGAGYLFLLSSMYFFSALLKQGAEWNKEFSALYYAFSLDMIVLPIGKRLYHYPSLLKYLTAITYYLELLGPFLLLSPIKRNICRSLFIGLFFAMHLGILLTLYVGLFPFISVVALLGVIPGSFWEKIHSHSTKGEEVVSPLEEEFQVVSSLSTFFILYSVYLNIISVWPYCSNADAYVQPISQVLRLDQKWGMFAPFVFRDDGWYVMEGKVAKGKIDIYQMGAPISYVKPDLVVDRVKNDRWRKYQENILFRDRAYLRPYYCRWLLKEWNKKAKRDQVVSELELVYMKEVTLSNYQSSSVTREVLCVCQK
jgi:hypothetical protein